LPAAPSPPRTRESLEIIGVETAAIPKTTASVVAGRRVVCPPADTIADALRATTPGALTFPILRDRDARIVSVVDDELRRTMRFAFEEHGVVCEPSGAAALAAVLEGDRISGPRRIGLVLSGSNVDAARFAGLTGEAAP
jgi:threonine dehydratase